ncbi:hypothetical protein [Nannocystis sp. SCPEA4]|uniref:hypothetical protein n=1 Tax=Nannocystis sp. SCPEA4 TaxID=2996787 RepID=UPI00226FF654|nr:hypothetical protein [Nannocystis sp. SCPEA4]MCY1055435.1 hypothetical protein [Nannocystis sp. SCPEA4]
MTTGVGHHQVIHGQGDQTIRTVPVNAHGRPTAVTSATYRIVDLRVSEDDPEREVVSSTNATIDNTSTTTTALCGLGTANERKIPVTATAGFVQGRRYLLDQEDGIRELVVIEALSTNSYVMVRDAISRKFPANSTLRGIEVSGIFPALEADDEEEIERGEGGPYAVDWSWDVDPSPRREMAWVVRHPDSLLITTEDLFALEPSISSTSGKRLKPETAIRQAATEIRAWCQAHQIDPDNFDGGTMLKLAVTYRAAWHCVRQQDGDANRERAQELKDESQKYLDSITIGQPPLKSVKTNPSTDTAPGGTSKPYHHWQVLS